MLVLTREVGNALYIGNQIMVTVKSVDYNKGAVLEIDTTNDCVIEEEHGVFYINGNIEIMVTRVDGSMVRIGIDAPMEIPIHREELYWKDNYYKHQ